MWPLPILSCVRLKIEQIYQGIFVWLKEEILGKSEKAIHHIENEGLYAPLSSHILIFQGPPFSIEGGRGSNVQLQQQSLVLYKFPEELFYDCIPNKVKGRLGYNIRNIIKCRVGVVELIQE